MSKTDKKTILDEVMEYEKVETSRACSDLVMVRLDGRGFSNFTRNFIKPYDEDFANCMISTTTLLMQETNAVLGYTQSDEITLVINKSHEAQQIYFGGRFQKIASSLSAFATIKFNNLLPEERRKLQPMFDARAWTMPKEKVGLNIIARELNCVKNSITNLSLAFFSHKELMNKNSTEKLMMLRTLGVEWKDQPEHFRRGFYIQKKTKENKRIFAPVIGIPYIKDIINRDAFIFNGEEPILSANNLIEV